MKRETTEERVNRLIEKYELVLVTAPNGKPAIRANKATPKAKEEIVELKEEIKAELNRRAEEAKKEWETKRKALEEEYLKTADIRRCMVVWQKESGEEHKDHCLALKDMVKTTYSIQNLRYVDGRVFEMKYGNPQYIEIYLTPGMREIAQQTKSMEFGYCGRAWEITPEQEAQILAEQATAKEEIERKKALEQAEKEAKIEEARRAREAKIAESVEKAKRTGKPVVIEKWSEPCDGSACECSLDIMTKCAMPDGTIQVTRTHTH